MASPQTLVRRYVGKQPHASVCLSKAAASRVADSNTSTYNNHSSKQADFAWMKHGIGRLTATADTATSSSSKLTEVSHKAPMRWLPLRSSKVEKAGAAVAAMSNYGAGLLPGDVNEVHVRVQSKARLGVLTQGSNRIYKQSQQQQEELSPAKSTLQARVEAGGLLVVAPDPTVPFASSSFHQQQHFRVHPTSSLIAVDWFSSGRYANGERWLANRLSSETKLSLLLDDDDDDNNNNNNNTTQEEPLVWDATTLDQRGLSPHNSHHANANANPFGFDLGQHSFNAFASVLLYGEESLPVVEQLQSLQYQLAESQTRLRRNEAAADIDPASSGDLGTTGRVLLGVNELQVSSTTTKNIGPVHMARWVGSSNEDLYRLLHHSLKPLAPLFGLEFYQDRIRATSSGPAVLPSVNNKNKKHGANAKAPMVSSVDVPNNDTKSATRTATLSSSSSSTIKSTQAAWNAYMLADSALPTGSFAHSSGLEAASQLGLLAPLKTKEDAREEHKRDDKDEDSDVSSNLQMFIQASTRSTLQQATPWIMSGYALGSRYSSLIRSLISNGENVSKLVEEWEQLDGHVHAVMVCGGPACRASLDQGRNLLRVSIPWLAQDSSSSAADTLQLLRAIQERINTNSSNSTTAGHVAPLFGIVGAALQLQPEETCHLLGYCVARDIVSAAVRLNLIGPLASVGLLSKAQSSAEEGVTASLLRHDEAGKDGANLLWSQTLTGGCAPVVDAVHPSHDLLAVRLFRT